VFTCRKELEDILGLRHPRRVVIEEAVDVPRQAERLFRGIYSEPDKLKRSFSELQRETVSIVELLTPRRNRFREWLEELPGSPNEAQEYMKETAMELKIRQERAAVAEARVLGLLQEQHSVNIFPLEEELLAKWAPERIVLYTRVIERLAVILKVPYETLNKVILVHMMTHVLIYSGEDRDKKNWARHELSCEGLEALVHYYSNYFHQVFEYKELAQADLVLQKYLAPNGREGREINNLSREQVASALIFWRRRPELSWRETLGCLREFI
jgi:hypothetical protein